MEHPIRAVLFDLDGTLLDSNMDILLPHYFRLLAAHMAHILPPEPFLAHLMRATQQMLDNNGRATNEEVFAQAFYPLAGHSRQEIEPLLHQFYGEVFPRLRRYTRPQPGARQVIQLAFNLNYDVVIATNPVFPEIAIRQRLEWAGVAGFPYRWVTTYENSRATKPSLLYFEHILQIIDQPPQASLVVGDEDMDMVAAHLGCPTFLVPGPRTVLAPGTPCPTYQGALPTLIPLLERRA
ncbi:MAG: HAD hydrolase-like protein [Anaerolineae bacterium]|jgi:phosphoglycolate phosphatase-like HAD superfamily hydrolase